MKWLDNGIDPNGVKCLSISFFLQYLRSCLRYSVEISGWMLVGFVWNYHLKWQMNWLDFEIDPNRAKGTARSNCFSNSFLFFIQRCCLHPQIQKRKFSGYQPFFAIILSILLAVVVARWLRCLTIDWKAVRLNRRTTKLLLLGP